MKEHKSIAVMNSRKGQIPRESRAESRVRTPNAKVAGRQRNKAPKLCGLMQECKSTEMDNTKMQRLQDPKLGHPLRKSHPNDSGKNRNIAWKLSQLTKEYG
jgi:hypothetical protein